MWCIRKVLVGRNWQYILIKKIRDYYECMLYSVYHLLYVIQIPALLDCRVGFFIVKKLIGKKKDSHKRVFLYFGSYYALRTLVAWGPR